MYTPLDINRENLTIMGIEFPDLKSLESAANAIGSNMFEGFEPTSKGIEIIRDYSTGKISLTELVTFAKKKSVCLILTNTLILNLSKSTLLQTFGGSA